ncbi:hypothetical protein Tco_1520343 [Tanacetum coccineum]
MQSSSISSDFTNKLLNLKNASLDDNQIASLMDTTFFHEEPSSQTSSLYSVPITVIPEITSLHWQQLGEAIQRSIKFHTTECREEALADKREYIDLINTSVRDIIKEEVKTQLPQILPQGVSDFANPVIERNDTESIEAVVLAKSSSQPMSTYEWLHHSQSLNLQRF